MIRAAFVLMTLIGVSGAVAQDLDAITIRLDEMTEDDWTAIQRGNGEAEWQCLQDVLAEGRSNGIPDGETYITFEDPNVAGVAVGYADTDSNYACEEGEMRSYEMGEYEVLRRYR